MKNMAHVFAFTVADRQFYAPLETAAALGERFVPRNVPDGWQGVEQTIWTRWAPVDLAEFAENGWKVHVSARPERTSHVLDIVARVCFKHGVPFKHLTSKLVFWWTQQRHGSRQQGGKFVAAYPRDVEAAGRLMEDLRIRLADEEGPFILSDRRYRDSRTVHYRYGAFKHFGAVAADGRTVLLVRDGAGALVPDRRGVSAHLPDGIEDPFLETVVKRPSADPGSSPLPGYTIESALQFSNAGGVYRGRETHTGRAVAIKEGRSHTGLGMRDATATEQLREEWAVLAALREVAPGVAPEPIAYLRVWEHEFMVSEFLPGETLGRWVAANHPGLLADPAADDLNAYYARCQRIIDGVERLLRRMHSVGYVFRDVSPNNVLVGPDDSVRLVDFGSAHRIGVDIVRFGTPGFAPAVGLGADDGTLSDDFGVSALALVMLSPLNQVVQRNPHALTHIHHELEEMAPVPAALWSRVTRYHDPGDRPELPGPDEVAADPIRHLTDLSDRIANAIAAMADTGNAGRVYPTIVDGYETNTVCVAFGTAGVVHALRRAGRDVPDGVIERLRRDALAGAPRLAPGLHAGTAGIARVLAAEGLLDEARDLLAMADGHPLLSQCATLGGGAAGVAVAHLALYEHTGDESHLDRALQLTGQLPVDEALTPMLGADNATGLLHGRCGVALALQQVAHVTGNSGLLDHAVGLLHQELDRAIDPASAGLLFPASDTDRRAMPYLYSGSAGMVYAVTRCLSTRDDERLSLAMPRLLATLGVATTVMPGLYQGVGGFAFALADHARLTGSEVSRQGALRAARALFKHAVPHDTGARFLGDGLLRFSAELWSGSAGVLLALSQVLMPGQDGLFAAHASPRTVTTSMAMG